MSGPAASRGAQDRPAHDGTAGESSANTAGGGDASPANNMLRYGDSPAALVPALMNSLAGMRHALGHERAIRHEAVVLAAAVPASFFVAAGLWQQVALIGVIILMIGVELLNSCVEKLCDHVTPQRHPQIKAVKDMGSAAVLCTIVLSILVWSAALYERLFLTG